MNKKTLLIIIAIIGVFSLQETANAQTLQQGNFIEITQNCEMSVTFPYDINNFIDFGATVQIGKGTLPSNINFTNPAITASLAIPQPNWPFWINNTPQLNGFMTLTGQTLDIDLSPLISANGTGDFLLHIQETFSTDSYFYPFFVTQMAPIQCQPFNTILPTDVNTIDFNTKFTGATVQGTSTSINFNVDYFLDTSEYTANTRPDLININVTLDGDGQMALARKIILPLANGNASATVPVNFLALDTKPFIDGDYYANINFWNLQSNSLVFNYTGVVLAFTLENGLITSQQIVSILDGTEISANIQYQDCSLSNIQGCLINAFIFVFVPAPDAFSKFLNLWQRIENKAPFGYVVGVISALNGLTDNATPAFDFGNIPFIDEIFTPFRALLIIALWVLYALYFMGRLSKIQI